jgi:hypothetical protein
MRLHSVTMVRDEDDIVEAFVRHNLQFVDRTHVVVHQSVDSTLGILEALHAEGLPVQITVSDDAVFKQGATLTALARSAFVAGAEFVFVLDADEFLISPSRAVLERNLATLPVEAIGAVPWRTYIPMPGDPRDEPNVLKRITHRPIRERKMLGKVILGPVFGKDPSLCLLEGSHWVHRQSDGEYMAQPMQVFGELALAHFPVRSVEQAVAKVLQRRWQRRIAWVDEPISRLVASGWRSTFERMADIALERGALTSEELAWFAYDYSGAYSQDAIPPLDAFAQELVRDPCGNGRVELRYAARMSNPLGGLYRWLDRVVRPTR